MMLTLQQIRDQSPCIEGWIKLLKSLGNPPMDTVISLGDVAKSNDAADAWWCVRALDWENMTLRRQVIAALMPSVERAAKHTTDKRVHDCIAVIHDWIAEKPADLDTAATAAAGASRAARGAEANAARAAQAAANASGAARAWMADAARAWAADAAGASRADAAAAERETQRQDLIAAFPPLILKDQTND
jgi:hypothetical protein